MPKASPKQKVKEKKSAGAGAKKSSVKSAKQSSENERSFPVVGIGASAGGLDAFKRFFTAMPSDADIAFVLIQHLDPNHESMLPELLGRCTQMQVIQARQGMEVEANHVYLIPPKKALVIRENRLYLEDFSERRGLRMPIDYFFRSLAEDKGDKSICLILSGTGSDGTLGLKAIKLIGGMAMVQDPGEAGQDGMPRSAISTGLVDYVLPVDDMPADLLKYVRHSYFDGTGSLEDLPEDAESQLKHILDLLKKKRLYDFNCYKRGTLIRRIERRMGVLHIESFSQYRKLLEKDPAEAEALSKDLLIVVTNFFRDIDAFNILAKKIIPDICQQANPDAPLRIWVPGTATGEEAYSLAILFFETLSRQSKDNSRIQIFATDIDRYALERARTGLFPETIEADVSAERLERFFDKREGEYQVKKFVRESITFSVQNLVTDPPFSRLELISCRNLLIYLTSEVQQHIITLFHFALKPGGYLFLGSAEGIGKQTGLFKAVNTKWRLFKKINTIRPPLFNFPLGATPKDRLPFYRKGFKPGISLRQVAERQMLKYFAPCGVMINDNYDIIHFIGDTSDFLKIPEGDPTMNLLSLVSSSLRNSIRSILHKLVSDKEKQASTILRLPASQSSFRSIQLAGRRIVSEELNEALYLITYDQLPEYEVPLPRLGPEGDKCVAHERVIKQLEDELQTSRRDLESTIEQLETANEELKAGNEEVMSMNEEFQSTNEELETSKEELQSLNEELTTVNAELQEKVAELEATTNDLDNLLASSDVGTIFLDSEFRIKRFTAAVRKLFHLIPSDLGRPLLDFESSFADFTLLDDARQVLDKLTPMEKEIRTSDGHWFLQRVLPYRTKDNRIEGVVVTFADVTLIKNMEQQASQKAGFLELLTNALPVRLAYVDLRERYQYVNDTYLDWVGLSRDQVIGKTIKQVLGRQAYDTIRPHFTRALAGEKLSNETTVEYRKAGKRHIMVYYAPQHDAMQDVIGFIAVIVDITARKQAEMNNAWLAAIIESSHDGIVSMNFDGTVRSWNKGAETIFGYTAAEMIGKNIAAIFPHQGDKKMAAIFDEVKHGKAVSPSEEVRRTKDGREIHVQINYSPIRDAAGKPVAISAIKSDITERKRMENALRESEQLHRTIGETVPFGTWTTDAEGRCTHVTRPFLEMTGLSLEEIKGFGWFDRVPEEERPQLQKDWLHCVETGEDWDYEYRILGGDGTLYDVLTIGRPVRDAQGKILFWAGFHLDITERKRMEQELQELNLKLEQKIAERTSELEENMLQLRRLTLELTQAEQRERQRLGTILHNDLQQLLVAMRLRLEKLATTVQIVGERNILQEVNDLLRQAVSTTRNLATDLRPPILNNADILQSLHWLADWFEKRFGFEVQLHLKENLQTEKLPDEAVVILFDAARELLFNVVKHAGVRDVSMSLQIVKDECLMLRISDKGMGTDAKLLEGENGKMAGSGLASIKDRLKILGGRLSIKSAAGKGFRAEILIPYTLDGSTATVWRIDGEETPEPTPAESCHLASASREGRKIRIMLVDDHAVVRDGISMILQEEEDLEIVGEAEDGSSAVELAAKMHPDVIIMDVNMPKMNGMEATRLIKKEMPDICIIALSINDDAGTANAMLNAGASAYFPKSGPSEKLISMIRQKC